MLAAALQQAGQAVQTRLASPRLLDRCASSHWYSPYPTHSDRECAIFHQKLHRCISSASLTDPPSVFF
jgi:hypothetical protein